MLEIQTRRSTLDAEFVQEFIYLHAIVNELSNMRCGLNQLYWQNVPAVMGNGDSLSLLIRGHGFPGLHAESAGAIIYVDHCAKILVELNILNYCT